MDKKVLFTASTFSHIRNFHLPYLRYFQQQGWEVHVACGGEAGNLPYADRVISLPFEKRMGSPSNFKAASILRNIIRQEGYALITTHTSLAAFFTRLAVMALRQRGPLVNMVHGYLYDDDTRFLKRLVLTAAEGITAGCTDLLLTMNAWDYGEASRRRFGKRVANVPGIGVDFSRIPKITSAQRQEKRRELGIPADAFVLFYAAEFSSRKSQNVLIRALRLLPEQVMLVLAGDGALLEECQSLSRELGLENRVLFPGYVRDVGPWYGMADAAVSASRIEGLPFNIMEAMYAGIPVVASAVKGHEDLITDGESGLLYPYGDDEACAGKISELLQSPELRERMAKTAADRILTYELESVYPIVLEQYESVLEKTPVQV